MFLKIKIKKSLLVKLIQNAFKKKTSLNSQNYSKFKDAGLNIIFPQGSKKKLRIFAIFNNNFYISDVLINIRNYFNMTLNFLNVK